MAERFVIKRIIASIQCTICSFEDTRTIYHASSVWENIFSQMGSVSFRLSREAPAFIKIMYIKRQYYSLDIGTYSSHRRHLSLMWRRYICTESVICNNFLGNILSCAYYHKLILCAFSLKEFLWLNLSKSVLNPAWLIIIDCRKWSEITQAAQCRDR